MSLNDTISQKQLTVTPEHTDTHFPSSDQRPAVEPELGPASDTLEFESEAPCGSMELGKKRNKETAVTTEPEKHLTPRAATKEFSFPKSN